MEKLDLNLLKEPLSEVNACNPTSFYESITQRKSSRTSLNGKWKIFYSEDTFNNDLLKEKYEYKKLQDIELPCNLELKGYGKPIYNNVRYSFENKENLKLGEIPHINPYACFFKEFKIIDLNSDYYIELNGFESAVYLYINGYFVGYSSLNMLNTRFKINEYIAKGDNLIQIINFKYSFASYYMDQDMWELSGINRDINLIKLPKTHFEDVINYSLLKNDYKTGIAKFKFIINEYKEGLVINFNLLKDDKNIINKNIKVTSKEMNFEEEIPEVSAWSDEEPNLYEVKIKLKEERTTLEEVRMNVGFRRIDVVKGTILLNGRRLIIKGVNRHEFSPNSGRSLTEDEIKEDLYLIKRNNINAIRTSHYPNAPIFYDLCDKLGILVMDEAPIETHGTYFWKDDKNNHENEVLPGSNVKYLDFTISRGKWMLKRDFNHPSIIFWSCGNESYEGRNLEGLYKYFKENDSSRLVHYENVYRFKDKYKISDVISKMYYNPKNLEKLLKENPETPVMECEFMHAMGNSLGNFDEYMLLLDKYFNFHLGFVWDFKDQGIYLNNKYHFGGDFGDYPNDNNFCANGILLSDGKERGKLKTLKYYYSPLKIDIEENKVIITNKYNFKNTSKFKFTYKLLEDSKQVYSKSFEVNIPSLSSKEVEINHNYAFLDDKEYVAQVEVSYKQDEEYFKKGELIFKEEKYLKGSYEESLFKQDNSLPLGSLEMFRSNNHLTIQNGVFKVIFSGFNSEKGGLEAIYYKDKCYLNHLVLPTFFRATTDNDRLYEKYKYTSYLSSSLYPLYIPFLKPFSMNYHKIDDEEIVVSYTYVMLTRTPTFFKVKYFVNTQNEIRVEYSYKSRVFINTPPLIGLRFKFEKDIKDFSYLGLGKEETYLDKLKGSYIGEYESNVMDEYIPYSIPQESGNHMYSKKISIPMNDKKLVFYPLEKSFNFKFLPYNEFELEIANRNEELVNSYNYLTINDQKGVGGDDSWGAKVHTKYLLKHHKYKRKFVIKIED